eukprot:1194480-Prorocentrum_minimum.AAC.3
MAEAVLDYSYEYQGNASKLVYTPLTDKCYLTLMQGMQLGYGGNPYGPAGTGKTESVKALGQCLARQDTSEVYNPMYRDALGEDVIVDVLKITALNQVNVRKLGITYAQFKVLMQMPKARFRQVLVFNCDEEFDFKSMGRIFMGLIKCGAWGCFDEFNRLDEEVLSAVSQQIQIIQQALKERQPSMEFMKRQVEVDHRAGIFVTLNPAGKGYGGRSKLPDNLKQLFRSVAMTVPDNDLIAEDELLGRSPLVLSRVTQRVRLKVVNGRNANDVVSMPEYISRRMCPHLHNAYHATYVLFAFQTKREEHENLKQKLDRKTFKKPKRSPYYIYVGISTPTQVLLLAEGFRTARELGRKVVSLFQLSKQLLSPQQHYDWGLRALKTVLGISGKLLGEARRAGGTGGAAMDPATVKHL